MDDIPNHICAIAAKAQDKAHLPGKMMGRARILREAGRNFGTPIVAW